MLYVDVHDTCRLRERIPRVVLSTVNANPRTDKYEGVIIYSYMKSRSKCLKGTGAIESLWKKSGLGD